MNEPIFDYKVTINGKVALCDKSTEGAVPLTEEEKRLVESGKPLKSVNGTWIIDNVQCAKNQLNILKQQLAGMDYKTSKHADGEYTETEWMNICAERKEVRRQIRVLEAEIAV